MPNVLRKLLGTVGGAFAIFCAAIATVGVGEVLAGEATAATWGTLVLLVGLGGFTASGAKRLLAAPSRPALPGGDRDSAVLALAATEGGRVTIPEVAAKTTLTLDEAHQTLQDLSRRGLAESIVTEEGVVIYEIRGLLGPAEKQAAIDLLDV
jgi:hypothetical protein